MDKKIRVLIGSTIRQEPEVLEVFLDSIRGLNKQDLIIDYVFVDDNIDQQSSKLLASFRPVNSKVKHVYAPKSGCVYHKDDQTHYWNEQLIWKIADYKNKIIKYCLQNEYQYLFLVDSDLVLHPDTLLRLISTGKDIISEIFWTKFQKGKMELPQVWLKDAYTIYLSDRGKDIDEDEKNKRTLNFLNKLRKPGLYKVGGLGACTLFSREPLTKGVDFSEVYNLSFCGEDRHLCVRAAALGYELYVDTHFPAYHVYRESELEGVTEYIISYSDMSLKAHKEIISTLLQDIFSVLEGCDYRNEFKETNFKKFFTDKGWANFNFEQKKERIIKNKLIHRFETYEINKIELDDRYRNCSVKAKIYITGSKAGQKLSKKRIILLDMTYKSGWKINDYSIINEEINRSSESSNRYKLEQGNIIRSIRAGTPRLTLAMLVHNEADRYLKKSLKHAARFIDEAVILDDGSTDNTVDLCYEILKDIPLNVESNPVSGFENEVKLRQQLWNLVIKTDPDWILCLDADEIFEDRAISEIKKIILNKYIDVYAFRLYDFWDDQHYREDKYWNAHLRYSPFLTRYQPEFNYTWNQKKLHCGRLPNNLNKLPVALSQLRIKHFGWACEKDRLEKYKRYKDLDPEGKYGIKGQYESILDSNPNLKKWEKNSFL